MANVSSPYGFQFVRNRAASSPTYQTSVYQFAYNNSNKFGKGDVMIMLSTGYCDIAATSSHSVLLGILDRVEYYDTLAAKKIFTNAWQAPSTALSGTGLAYVIDDPNVIFGCQSGNGGPFTQAHVHENASMGGNGAPSTLTGISVAYLDYGTVNTTNTLLFKINAVPQNLGGVPVQNAPIGNDSTTQYNYVEVTMNTPIAYNMTGI